jgi:hypothetical protein
MPGFVSAEFARRRFCYIHGKPAILLSIVEQKSWFLVVKKPDSPGSNACGAYHPEVYVRHCLADGFDVVDFIQRGIPDADQDIYLLQKK